MARCRSCSALIVWAFTFPKSKPMPVDANLQGGVPTPTQVEGGGLTQHGWDLSHSPSRRLVTVTPNAGTMRSHWASCPNANTHRTTPGEPT